MNCYIDSSVILRRLFKEADELKEWSKVTIPFSSRLLQIECLRVFDRWKLRSQATINEIALKHAELFETLAHMALLPLTDNLLKMAEHAMPLPLGTLDSIHLMSAVAWREQHGDDFLFATHDHELGLAAKAYGLKVIGLS